MIDCLPEPICNNTMLQYSWCISNRSYEAKQPPLLRPQHRVSSGRITLCSGGGGATVVSSSSRLRDLVFVVNPQGMFIILLLSGRRNDWIALKWWFLYENQTLEGGSLEIEFDFGLRVELGANGRTAQEWNKLLPYLRSRLGGDCNVSFFWFHVLVMPSPSCFHDNVCLFVSSLDMWESLTSGPSHAIDITREVSGSSEKLFIALIGYVFIL